MRSILLSSVFMAGFAVLSATANNNHQFEMYESENRQFLTEMRPNLLEAIEIRIAVRDQGKAAE